MESREALLLFIPILGRNRQDPDSGVVGRDNLKLTVLNILERTFHVALSAEHPDIANENVLQGQGLILALHGHVLWFGLCRHGGERDFPGPIFVCRRGLGLTGEGYGHLLAGSRPPPDGHRLVALDDHIRLEQVVHAETLSDRGDINDVLARQVLLLRRRRLHGKEPDGHDGQQVSQYFVHLFTR